MQTPPTFFTVLGLGINLNKAGTPFMHLHLRFESLHLIRKVTQMQTHGYRRGKSIQGDPTLQQYRIQSLTQP